MKALSYSYKIGILHAITKFAGIEQDVHSPDPTDPSNPETDSPPVADFLSAVDSLDVALQNPTPDGTQHPEKNVAWGAPTNLAGGDTASRLPISQPVQSGAI